MFTGNVFTVNVELTTSGTLACDLVVTLVIIPGTATGEKHNLSVSDKLIAAHSFQ